MKEIVLSLFVTSGMKTRDVIKLRKRMGLTQPEFATFLGLRRAQTISDFETGKTILKGSLKRFMEVLDTLSRGKKVHFPKPHPKRQNNRRKAPMPTGVAE